MPKHEFQMKVMSTKTYTDNCLFCISCCIGAGWSTGCFVIGTEVFATQETVGHASWATRAVY